LGDLLYDAGYVNIQHKAHVIDYSFGKEAYEGFRRDAAILFKLVQPYVVGMEVATQGKVDQVYEQMLLDMMKDDFRGLMFLLTVWGERPNS
jgi:hypothetical protein